MENYMFQDMSKDFDIKKIRRSNTISESNCEPHVHPFHEIFYLSSGECTSFIDHNIYKFGKGDLVIVPGGCLHKTVSVSYTHLRFKNISGSSSESAVSRGYIETMLELPWNKASKDNKDLKNAERILNEDHYGLEKVKERMLEFLAVRNLTKKGESPIVCLVGPPGTGKTSIARSVARALDKKYVRISLGGVRDEAEIRGHRKTYVGAMPGRIVNGLRSAGAVSYTHLDVYKRQFRHCR